jgi:curli biogenesis system outer membrane secretion channel CsgG
MRQAVLLTALLLALTGCGLAETGVTAGAGAASKADEVREGKRAEARVQQQIDAAYSRDAEQRKAAEAESQ